MSAHYNAAVFSVVRSAVERARTAIEMAEPDTRWSRLCRSVDPAKAIRDLSSERLTGAEREATDELWKRRPPESGNCARIPWETLAFRAARYNTRADIVGTASAGGFLVQTLNFASAAQALLSMLVLGRLGATPVDSDGPNLNLPKVTNSSVAYWLSEETTDVTESDQTFGQLSFAPHTVGGVTQMSRLLTIQSRPDAGDVVANDLARKLKRAIEAAAFAGSGVAGQPHGLTGLTGVNAVSGATFALSTACTAATDTGDALTDDANPGWAANRSVASLLRQRQELTNSSLTLWRGPLTWGSLADFPAGSTSGIASGTAFFGNWAYLILMDFGGGLDIAVNPYGQPSATPPYAPDFQAGLVWMRAFATIDVGAVWPAAFSTVTGIT